MIILSVFVLSVIIAGRLGCKRLQCITSHDMDTFRVTEVYEDTATVFRALYQHNDVLLRIDVQSKIPPTEAQNRVDGQLAQIKTIFAKARAPYPGEITNIITCDKQYQPSYRQESVNGLSMTIVQGFLTDRLTYGACTPDQAVNRSMLALFYCPTQKKLYQLEFIAPVTQFNESQPTYDTMLQSLRCM